MPRIHLDTDFAGDPDDACALALLLGWPDVEITGITTSLDARGERADCVGHYLRLAGREDIPFAAGASASATTGEQFASTAHDPRCWPDGVKPGASPQPSAQALLARSLAAGATFVVIGAATNLARLAREQSAASRNARVVMMGGWWQPAAPGLPDWGPETDFNVQCDRDAARALARHFDVTWVTLAATLSAWLRARDLPRLRAAGPVGDLLATQSEQQARSSALGSLGARHAGLPDDLVNFHYDPVTCAVALGWAGATIETRRLALLERAGALRLVADADAKPARVVTAVDGEAFAETWLRCVERIGR